MTTVYIGLGANLESPLAQLKNAIKALAKLPNSQLDKLSSFYGSKPLGPQDQPDYINAVVSLTTTLTPLALLDELQTIEKSAGRVRKAERWGPRILDLDILLFAQQVINTERLTVPHYDLTNREFVLLPLAEIAQGLILPCGSAIAELAQHIPHNGIEIIDTSSIEHIVE